MFMVWMTIIFMWYTLGILTGVYIGYRLAPKEVVGTRWRDGSVENYIDGAWRKTL